MKKFFINKVFRSILPSFKMNNTTVFSRINTLCRQAFLGIKKSYLVLANLPLESAPLLEDQRPNRRL